MSETFPEKNFPINQEKPTLPSDYLEFLKERGLDAQASVYQKVLEIASAIQAEGGRALLVGGAVRDMLIGKIPKDFDLEIYKLPAEKIEKIARKLGKVSEVGKAFGILKISVGEGIDIDLSLPRLDSKIGAGHRGFEVKTNPNMSFEDAARRRDFTINSMSSDPLTGELIDPFNGLTDLRERRLKVTDPERFKDDPLRVLRGLQFISRFGLEVEPATVKILQEMAPLLKELPKERILDEWKKLLLKSDKPSLGLCAGMTLGILHHIHPELPPLRETPQEPEWHPEGDVWIHTLMVVDEAAKIVRRENLNEEQAFTIMTGALCHDLGKPLTTSIKEGRIISHAHEQAGEEPTKNFLEQINADNLTREKVVKLVTNHLVPTLLFINDTVRNEPVSDGAIRRLAKRLHPATIQELVLVAEADHLGRGFGAVPETAEELLLPEANFPAGPWLVTRARKLAVEDSKPADLTQGRDWVAFGYNPGKNIGKLIQLTNDLRDEKGYTREMVFEAIDKILSVEEAMKELERLLKG
ncbi:MAG: HD domain-containing protein [Patescibacteria group bacterium]